jgi:hypothetical protein
MQRKVQHVIAFPMATFKNIIAGKSGPLKIMHDVAMLAIVVVLKSARWHSFRKYKA